MLFPSKGFRCLKHFYTQCVCKHLTHLSLTQCHTTDSWSYRRKWYFFLRPLSRSFCLEPVQVLLMLTQLPLRVSKHQRILIHKTFKGLAERGKCSMGWLFRFKLHLIINDRGEIFNFMFALGYVDDREPLYSESFIEKVKVKLCGDNGYIGKQLLESLFMNGIQLVTKIKNNMMNSLMTVVNRIMLRKRTVIESVNYELKKIAHIEHSRHRSFTNFITNAFLSAIAADCFFPMKPSISL